jgi:hypothetical protein
MSFDISKSRMNSSSTSSSNIENSCCMNNNKRVDFFEDIDVKKNINNKKTLIRKKSVTFSNYNEKDLDMSDIRIINKRVSFKNKSKSIDDTRLMTPGGSMLASNINNNNQDSFESVEVKALKDISTELVNYVMKNAVKIAINEMKASV